MSQQSIKVPKEIWKEITGYLKPDIPEYITYITDSDNVTIITIKMSAITSIKLIQHSHVGIHVPNDSLPWIKRSLNPRLCEMLTSLAKRYTMDDIFR